LGVMEEACQVDEQETANLQVEPRVVSFAGKTLRDAKDAVEYELLSAELERSNGNIMRTADVLGVSRPTLYGLLKKHNLLKV